MNVINRISRVFQSADEILFDDSTKIILMSDCHRGDGSWADDFSKNQDIFFTALNYYYDKEYTYIELGDGDELWENRNMSDIIDAHSDAFWIMSKFYQDSRLYFIYGNHDIVKRNNKFVRNNLYQHYSQREKKYVPLFPDIKIHEGLILKHRTTGDKILLTHGHQVDFLNYDIWRIARFLVRYLWRPLELVGVNEPTRTATNYKRKEMVARRLTQWVKEENHMLIAGHNHRPMFSEVGAPQYFNDGSCVHPRCITGIEIVEGCIMLVKWCIKTKADGTLFIGKEVLAGPRKLNDYFNIGKAYKGSVALA